MIELLAAATVITGIDARPEALTGASGLSAYTVELSQFVAQSGVKARLDSVFADCPSLTFASAGFATEPLPAAARQAVPALPDSLFIDHIVVSGCDKTLRLNIVAYRLTGQNRVSFALDAPGNSLATLETRSEADHIAVNLVQDARRQNHGARCDMVAIVYDTEVTSVPAASNGVWTEIWRTRYCNVRHAVEMTFTPVGDHTEISARLKP